MLGGPLGSMRGGVIPPPPEPPPLFVFLTLTNILSSDGKFRVWRLYDLVVLEPGSAVTFCSSD